MTTVADMFAAVDDAPELDSVPPDLSDVEHPCATCGREVTETTPSGRIKKRHAACAPSGSRASSAPRQPTGKAVTLATQASEVLSQYNSMIALGLMSFGLHAAAKEMFDANELFKATAQEVLIADEEFARWIIGGGKTSAKVTLTLGYIALGARVAPVAVQEWREKHPREDVEGE